MKAWTKGLLFCALVVGGASASAGVDRLAMTNLKYDLESRPAESADLIFGDGVAAVRWREDGSWTYFYDDNVQDLHEIAKILNRPKIIVERAKTADELYNRVLAQGDKAPGYKPIKVTDPRTKKEVEIARLVKDERKRVVEFMAALRPEPKLEFQPIEEDGPLAAELNCLKALGDRNLQGVAETKGFVTSAEVMTNDGEPNGIYFFTPKGGKFVALNSKKFPACVDSTSWGGVGNSDVYALQLKFPGRKPAYVGVQVMETSSGVKPRVSSTQFPDESTDIGKYCEVELKETLDDKMREVLHAKISDEVSRLYYSYQRRLTAARMVGGMPQPKDVKAKQSAAKIYRLPNSENELDRLEVCKKVNDPKVQTAVYSEIGKFSAPQSGYWPEAPPQSPVKGTR